MSIKTLLLAGVLSLAAMSAAYAEDGPGGPTDNTGRSHASAAPACGYECPVLAGDTGPGSPGDDNGRSGARVAGDGGPGTPVTITAVPNSATTLTGCWPLKAGPETTTTTTVGPNSPRTPIRCSPVKGRPPPLATTVAVSILSSTLTL